MKRRVSKIALISMLSLCGMFSMTSCGGDKPSSSQSASVVDIGLALDKTEATVNINKTVQLAVSVTDGNTYTYSWKSEDTEIATVDKTGLVTGLKEGTTNITVTAKKQFKAVGNPVSCRITVKNKSLTLDQTEVVISMSESATAVLTPTLVGVDSAITWSSSDTTVCTVENGTVTGLKAGNAVITATCEDLSATCNVTVYSSYFELAPKQIVALGNETPVALASGQLSADTVWTVENQDIATVTDGKITGHAIGMTKVTATSATDNVTTDMVIIVKGTGEEPTDVLAGKNADAAANANHWYYLLESEQVTTVDDAIPTVDNGLINFNIATIGTSGPNFAYLRYQTDTIGDVDYEETLYAYCDQPFMLNVNGTADIAYEAGLQVIKQDYTSQTPANNKPSQIKIKSAGNFYFIPVFKKVGETAKLHLSETKKTLNLQGTDEEKSFTLTATVSNNDNPTITWTSDHPEIAKVEDGVVTAVGEGVATITATCGELTDTCVVTVLNEAGSLVDLASGNKSTVLANPGTWYYFADGKSAVSTRTMNNDTGVISYNITAIDTDGKKYAYLRYQPTETVALTATIKVAYSVGTEEAKIDLTGGDVSTAVSFALPTEQETSTTFTFTPNTTTPFQMKFYNVGMYQVTVSFAAATVTE